MKQQKTTVEGGSEVASSESAALVSTEGGVPEMTEEREQWGNNIDFILSCVGYAVGLGNILRFPYLAGKNGGAAFMIPYMTMMVFAGFPTFYMELVMGQYARVTPLYIYGRMSPLFTGLGHTMLLLSVYTAVYYNLYMAWILRYFYDSVVGLFTGSLPWEACVRDNTTGYDAIYFDLCQDDKACEDSAGRRLGSANYTVFRDVCYSNAELHRRFAEDAEFNAAWHAANRTGFETAAGTYFNYVFGKNKTAPLLDEWGAPMWDIVLCLFIAWVLVFLTLIRGVKFSGKVVYFTATFPYFILLVLMIIGLSLDGAGEGLKFYLYPKWSKLLDYQIWIDATQQIFFSLGIGGGGLTTLATYNRIDNNLMRDTILVVLGNCGTSFLIGFVVFPIIGFISHRSGIPIEQIAASGPGLAFTSYPDAIAHFPQPILGKILGILFFFMMLLLGVDSQLVIVEVVVTACVDTFPPLKKNVWLRAAVVGLICILCFLAGLILCTKSGPALQNILDTCAGGWPLIIGIWVEILQVSYCYGVRRFVADIKMMMGTPPNKYWRWLGYPVNGFWWVSWVFITPFLVGLVLVFLVIDCFNGYFMSYDDKEYPAWGFALGVCIMLSVIIWIPTMMLVKLVQSVVQRKGMKWLLEPAEDWAVEMIKLVEKKTKAQTPEHEIPLTEPDIETQAQNEAVAAEIETLPTPSQN